MPPSTSTLIEIGSIFARVQSANAAALVASALRYTRTTFAANRSGGYGKKPRRERFSTWEQDGSLRILVGHVGRAKELLERAGLAVTIQDHRRCRAQAAPNLALVEVDQGNTRLFLETITREPRCLIQKS